MDLNQGFEDLKRIVKEYAPEIIEYYAKRIDISEEKGVRTGRLHENHILGIILKHDFEDEKDVTTSHIEEEYQHFFKKVARSTVSTYLNQLEKEGVLLKKRDGRNVNYFFAHPPNNDMHPFWIVRNFCIFPAYLSRAIFLGHLYLHIPKAIENYKEEYKFLLGLSIMTVLKNRVEKCQLCQFGQKHEYNELKEKINKYIQDRIDVLPTDLRSFILKDLGELPIFGGINIVSAEEEILKLFDEIMDKVERFHNDIEFQISVSKHRQRVHLKRLEEKKE